MRTEPRVRSQGLASRLALSMALSMVLGLVVAGCTLVGTEPATPPAPPPPTLGPAIVDGEATEASNRAVLDLLVQGEALLEAGDAEGARMRGQRVVEEFPGAVGSSGGYWLEARAEAALSRWEEARGAAARYVELAGTGDAAGAGAQLLQAEAAFRGGLGGATESLFAVPPTTVQEVQDDARALGRQLARNMDEPTLRALLEEAPSHPWLLPVFQVELGERRALVGDLARAEALARQALEQAPGAEEEDRASRILAGDVVRPEGAVSGVLSAILSESGSPGLQQLSQQIREGVEVALQEEGIRGSVALIVEDDRGQSSGVAAAMAAAAEQTPFAVVGPLMDEALVQAAQSRGAGAPPLISPTSRTLPAGVSDVYTIAGADPEALRVLADLLWSDGHREAVLFHRRHPEEDQEVEWLRSAYEGLGGRILRSYSYAPGSTTFNEPLQAIASLRPRALVLVIPPEDVELVAPQLAFYGVDDVADLQIYGSAAWSTDGVLDNVPVRHTDGVRTVASHVGPGYGPEWERFSGLYEARFQRTLRSPVPGLGWDAARLLLTAAAREGSAPDQVARGLTTIQNLSGATGTFSYRNGRISRSYQPVRIQNRTLVPLTEER